MSVPRFDSTMAMILLAAIGFGFEAASQGTASPTFTEVVDSLDLTAKTPLYVEQYWLEVKGKEVAWSGVVKNVKGRKGNPIILYLNEVEFR